MFSLAEYRGRPQRLADFLPWAALVQVGVVLDKDGSFQRSARFRGPDLDSATPAELVSVTARLNSALKRLGSGWAVYVDAQRVTRLSRKVLIGVGAVTAAGLGGALVLALQTKDGKREEQELYTTGHKVAADGLNALPTNYASIPKLGPPLPGDFGHAMLNQAARGTPHAEGTTVPGAAAAAPLGPVAQRRMQEDEAAALGGVFAARAGSETAQSTEREAGAALPSLDASGAATGPTATTPLSAAEHKVAFLAVATDRKTINSGTLQPPASPYVVQAGSIIPAALLSGVRSDLPGQIVAQVRETVYDSPTGRLPLIPQGARLFRAVPISPAHAAIGHDPAGADRLRVRARRATARPGADAREQYPHR